MDDFSDLFSPQDDLIDLLPFFLKPEVQDALDRILNIYGRTPAYRVEFDPPVPTDNPAVERVEFQIFYDAGTMLFPAHREIWVDGYQLMFTAADDPGE